MKKRYKILKGLPTYGDMAIPITSNDELFVSEGYVVKFYKDDGAEWIANFQMGWTETSKVIAYTNSNLIMIIVGGTAYIMNPNTMQPLKIITYGITEVLSMDDGKFIISNETTLAILDKNAEIEWHSKYIGWDGIKDLKLDGNIVTGYAYNVFAYEELDTKSSWIKFTLNIETKEIEGGTFSPHEIVEKKLGWRYWFIFILIVGSFQFFMHYFF